MTDKELISAIRSVVQEELTPIKERIEIVETKLDAVSEAVVQNMLKLNEMEEKIGEVVAAVKTNSFDIAKLRHKVS